MLTYGGFCWFASQLDLCCCANPCKTDGGAGCEEEKGLTSEGPGERERESVLAEAEGEALPPWVGISCITRTSLNSIALVPACGGRGEDRPCRRRQLAPAEGGRANELVALAGSCVLLLSGGSRCNFD